MASYALSRTSTRHLFRLADSVRLRERRNFRRSISTAIFYELSIHMMLRATLTSLSFLLLGAHFFEGRESHRHDDLPMPPGLLLIKARWSLRFLQVLTYAGVLIWLRTTMMIYQNRVVLGLPWGRTFIILGSVMLLTLVSGLLLHSLLLRKRFPVSLMMK